MIPAGHGTRAVLREHARAELAAGVTSESLTRLSALGRRLRLEPGVVATVLAEELH